MEFGAARLNSINLGMLAVKRRSFELHGCPCSKLIMFSAVGREILGRGGTYDNEIMTVLSRCAIIKFRNTSSLCSGNAIL